jgi:hypothetical protein
VAKSTMIVADLMDSLSEFPPDWPVRIRVRREATILDIEAIDKGAAMDVCYLEVDLSRRGGGHDRD